MAESFRNLVELHARSSAAHPDRPLFGTKSDGAWRWITYGQFARMVDGCRAALGALGVGPGDRVAMIADNRVEWAAACYATYGLGGVFVPMYEAQHAEEWRFILADCGAKVAFAATPDIARALLGFQADLPALQNVVGLAGAADGARSWADLLAERQNRQGQPADPSPAETAGLIYTSGTTGRPKGVILSHGNITSNINAIHSVFTFAPDDRSLAFLPWAHSFGQTCELHGLVSMGCSIAINDTIANLVGNLAEVQPTVLFAVPRVFNRLYGGVRQQIAEKPAVIRRLFDAGVTAAVREARGERPGPFETVARALADRLIFSTIRARFGGRLRYAISGSAALDRTVAEFIDALGITVYEGYGLTETSPIATANWPGARRMGTVGRAIPEVRIQIDRQVTGDEVQGEIVVYGPNVMQGYHNRPEETAAALTPDGGLRTGDLGRLDDEGFLWITGRIKEQYKLENGKYVVPAPLEEQLKLSPYIANVLVHGENRPHNVAVVVPEATAVRAWARANDVALDTPEGRKRLTRLIADEIEAHSTDWKGYEKIRAVVLVDEDFTPENGLLTPTLKLKRRSVLDRYGRRLAELYAAAHAA